MTKGEDRYARQRVLPEIGDAGQEKLLAASVLVAGCGALGSAQAQLLARAGVGRLVVLDRDLVELSNLQRQLLFDEEDVASGLPKAEAAARHLRKINSEIQIDAVVADVTPRNVERYVTDVELVLDATDNFETRYLINDACVSLGRPWIYGGAIGTSGMAMTIDPGRGPCLRCLLPNLPAAGSVPTCETQGVLNAAPALVASLQVTAAIKRLVDGPEPEHKLSMLDLWRGSIRSVKVPRDKDCPTCVQRKFEFLEAEQTSWATALCGREAVQITPPEESSPDLKTLSERLDKIGAVSFNGLLLRFEVDTYTFTLFPDGRTIVHGTGDEVAARSLYAKYIGT